MSSAHTGKTARGVARFPIGLALILTTLAASAAGAQEGGYSVPLHAVVSMSGATSIRVENGSGHLVINGKEGASQVSATATVRGSSQRAVNAVKLIARREGDAIVVAHAATRTRRTYDTFYNGWGWRWRWGPPDVIVNEFQVGTIVVDMFDARTKTAVWHGYASHALSDKPEKNDMRADQAVAKIFERFPTAS